MTVMTNLTLTPRIKDNKTFVSLMNFSPIDEDFESTFLFQTTIFCVQLSYSMSEIPEISEWSDFAARSCPT